MSWFSTEEAKIIPYHIHDPQQTVQEVDPHWQPHEMLCLRGRVQHHHHREPEHRDDMLDHKKLISPSPNRCKTAEHNPQ